MLNGFYTAASGMLIQQRALNVLSNNMANIKTPGFKTERVVSSTFENELSIRREGGEKTAIGRGTSMRIVKEVSTRFDPNYLEKTDKPFDMAINGEGFFCIQGDNQIFLTRNGGFEIDEQGYLVLKGAGRVLGESGEILLGTSNFTVLPDGSIYNKDNRYVNRLLIRAPQPENLEKFANGLFTAANPNQNDYETSEYSILSGMLERSNIDLNREMSMVMEAQRAFQSCGTLLKGIDQLNEKTVNQIANI